MRCWKNWRHMRLLSLLATLYTTFVGDPQTTLTEVDEGTFVTKARSTPAFQQGKIRFIVAGDAYRNSYARFQEACRLMALEEPDFIVLGGDLCYTVRCFDPRALFPLPRTRWKRFFEALPAGIPLLIAPGNHDVKGERGLFYTYFPQLRPTYQKLTFGSLLTLLLLDTDHGYPIEGAQTAFVQEALSQCQTRYKIAAYHIPAYPSRKEEKTTQKLHTHWLPLFDTYHVDLVFEHHNHTYKKTYPMKGGKIDLHGTVYLGDGALSVTPRTPLPHPYLADSGSLNFFYVVNVDGDRLEVTGVSLQGQRWAVYP